MFTFVPSLQKAIVSRSSRVAVVLAVAGSTTGFIGPVSADPLHGDFVELAQASSREAERCQQLYGVWQRYKANSTNGSGRDVRSQAALQDCRNGRVDAGIVQLEQLLRDDRIPVPGEPSSAAR
jgi:hypothetical protein